MVVSYKQVTTTSEQKYLLVNLYCSYMLRKIKVICHKVILILVTIYNCLLYGFAGIIKSTLVWANFVPCRLSG